MGWFGFVRRKPHSEASSSPLNDGAGTEDIAKASKAAGGAVAFEDWREDQKTVDVEVDDGSHRAQTMSEAAPSNPLQLQTAVAQEQEGGGQGQEGGEVPTTGYTARLKAAVLDCVITAKRAPETLEEALAVIKGEGPVKPDYGRAISTVSAAFAGGCAHGWWHSSALATKYPPHQRSMVRVRAGAGKGVRFAAFALIFESSSAVMEALRQKKDFVGGTVGGALAGMAYGVSGGVAATRRGLFYGVWLGGVFGLFRNHVAQLKEQARLAAEDARLAQEERDLIGRTALQRSIASLDAQLETWPTADVKTEQANPKESSRRQQ